MKKTLIALAALASIGSAFAADAPAVTFTPYINFDTGLASTTYGGAPNKNDTGLVLTSGTYASSGVGFNGAAEVGHGLKAVLNVEGRFSAVDGSQSDAGKLFGASANAGLTGGFGTVTGGLNWSPFDSAWGTDALEYNGFSAISAAYNNDVHGDNGTSGHGSVKGSLLYVSPAFSGVTVSAMYAPQADNTATAGASKYYGFGVSYANGPLSVNLGTEHIATATNGSTIVSTDNTNNSDAYIIGVAYNLGAITLDGSYKASKVTGDTTSGKDSGYGLGVAYALSETDKLAAGWATDTASGDTYIDSKITSFGVQYTKALSKNAKLYAGARKTDKNALLSTNTVGGSPTYTTTLYAAGVRFSF